MGPINKEIVLDDIDLRLLKLLQKDALASTEAMGEAGGLSPTAAKRRANRLRSSNVIIRDSAVVDPQLLGFRVFTLVFVNLERDRREIVNSFKQTIRNHPRIIQGFYITGDADFLLLVASKTLEDYEQFTQDFFWENPNIKNFKTMVIMDSIKVGFELPIDI
jgi:Lrp/AsnC family leucine-responsive transcriptional regulator